MAINDPAYMTCVGNDFRSGTFFVRWVEAFGKPGDVLLAISTSGNSQNIVTAAAAARRLGMKVVALTAEGPTSVETADVVLQAPHTPFRPYSGDTYQSYPHRDRGPRKRARLLIPKDVTP